VDRHLLVVRPINSANATPAYFCHRKAGAGFASLNCGPGRAGEGSWSLRPSAISLAMSCLTKRENGRCFQLAVYA
jgi:hypothetical protein